MGRNRTQLHDLLKDMVDHVYFQPPNGLAIEYPCITYQLDDARNQYADNKPYNRTKRYAITVIDRDPDSAIPDKVAALPMCDFNRFFTAENLNHYVYNLYF